ncbi:hypothetical protein [Pseudomonas sp.]|uniref:hypothetical protein n=1 Tax=Pseudomonas sp. TaxID=306 RepID=UPI0037C61BC2
MLGLAEGRPLSSQKTIGKSDRLLGANDLADSFIHLLNHQFPREGPDGVPFCRDETHSIRG